MPSTIGKCKLFRIKHITLLEGETFLRNKHEIAFFEIKCTFFGRKENTIILKKKIWPECILLISYKKKNKTITIFSCYEYYRGVKNVNNF